MVKAKVRIIMARRDVVDNFAAPPPIMLVVVETVVVVVVVDIVLVVVVVGLLVVSGSGRFGTSSLHLEVWNCLPHSHHN